jgi:hypothetical protein
MSKQAFVDFMASPKNTAFYVGVTGNLLRRVAEHKGRNKNGEAKAVRQDVASFEETQKTLALLKILALGHQDVAAGKVQPADNVVARLRAQQASV